MQSNYLKLAEQYASFLAALGGVSITVLTLVLALERKPTRLNLHSALVASLVVATLTCFTGAFLMAETAAYVNKLLPRGEVLGERLFLVASINIYIAVMLFIFSLMLLPAAYGIEDAPDVTGVTKWVFLFVVCGAYFWMIRWLTFRVPTPEAWYAIGVALILGLGWGVYLALEVDKKNLPEPPFILLVCFIASSLFYFNLTLDYGGKPSRLDIWFLGLGVTISCACLLGLGFRFMWKRKTVSNALPQTGETAS